MPKVKGGFDLMAYDGIHHQLYLSAQDNHTIEIFDLANSKHLKSISGFAEPKWIYYHTESNVLYVATGLDGKVTALNASNYKVIKTFAFREKCNNLRFDPITHQLFVGVGQAFGSIGIIDVMRQQITGEIKLAASPKQFELTPDRIYVNVPEKALIQVIDRTTSQVIANWPVECNKDNVPMAIDKINHLLYIGCSDGQLLIYSTSTGKEISRIRTHKEADGIYLDTTHASVYVSCGEGFIDNFSKNGDKLLPLEQIATRKGAGTSLLIPETNQYILAKPRTETLPAAIEIFQPVL